MATFDHERAHLAANLVSDPPPLWSRRGKNYLKKIFYEYCRLHLAQLIALSKAFAFHIIVALSKAFAFHIIAR